MTTRPDPVAWLKVVTREPGGHEITRVHRWPGFTAEQIRANRTRRWADARTPFQRHDGAIILTRPCGDIETYTFHDQEPT